MWWLKKIVMIEKDCLKKIVMIKKKLWWLKKIVMVEKDCDDQKKNCDNWKRLW